MNETSHDAQAVQACQPCNEGSIICSYRAIAMHMLGLSYDNLRVNFQLFAPNAEIQLTPDTLL